MYVPSNQTEKAQPEYTVDALTDVVLDHETPSGDVV